LPRHDATQMPSPPGRDLRWLESVQPIEYMGSSTSLFQAEPLCYDGSGRPIITSDWELELLRRVRGEYSHIPRADTQRLPRFLSLRSQYLARSAQLLENIFRFSFEFSRLCPKAGEFDEGLMREYAKTLVLSRIHGQEPLVTLQHFTMPADLVDFRGADFNRGAWEHPDVTKRFRFYIENVVRFLSDEAAIESIGQELGLSNEQQGRIMDEGLVKYFVTINEPVVVLYNGYVIGLFPPFKRMHFVTGLRVLQKLVEAHDIATTTIKNGLSARKWQPQAGVAYNWQFPEGLFGKGAQELHEYSTRGFERGGGHSDFVGLNYYFRYKFFGKRRGREYGTHPSFGDVYPRGILQVLTELHRYCPAVPIFITEFGFADDNDLRRPYWMIETLRYIMEAMQKGVPVKGVLVWTLVNNFEWDLGMSQKFGLFDEAELDKPLLESQTGISSWEVWQTAIATVRSPTRNGITRLQRCYERARRQYKEAGGKF
jgi:beta-glucosidase